MPPVLLRRWRLRLRVRLRLRLFPTHPYKANMSQHSQPSEPLLAIPQHIRPFKRTCLPPRRNLEAAATLGSRERERPRVSAPARPAPRRRDRHAAALQRARAVQAGGGPNAPGTRAAASQAALHRQVAAAAAAAAAGTAASAAASTAGGSTGGLAGRSTWGSTWGSAAVASGRHRLAVSYPQS